MPLFGSLTFEKKVPELTSRSRWRLTPINPQFSLLCGKNNRVECQKRKTCCPQSHNWEKLYSHCEQERDFTVNRREEPQDSEGSSPAQPNPSPQHHEDTSHTLVSFHFDHIAPLVHLTRLTSHVSRCCLYRICACHGFNLSLPALLLRLLASLSLHNHCR